MSVSGVPLIKEPTVMNEKGGIAPLIFIKFDLINEKHEIFNMILVQSKIFYSSI